MAAVQTARTRHVDRAGFVVQLTDADGRIGLGEATPLPSQGTESLVACREALAQGGAALAGQELQSIEAIDALLQRNPLRARPAARCALELALLDLLGQERGLAIAGLLSPRVHASVEVSALLVEASPDALAAEAALRVRAGFTTLKLKVAAGALGDDLARVRAVRAAAGSKIAIRIDANGGWSVEAARAALAALCAEGPIELCEQPVATTRELLALQPAPCPIGADELLADPAQADAILAARAVDVLVLKPMVLGGLMPALQRAREAGHAGMDVVVTTTLDGAVARAGALHLAAACPGRLRASGLATGSLLERDLAPEPIRCAGGRVAAPLQPGLGVKLHESPWAWEPLS